MHWRCDARLYRAHNKKLSSLVDERSIPDIAAEIVNNGYAIARATDYAKNQIEEVFAVGDAFFSEQLDVKLSARLQGDLGYRPIGIEFSDSVDHPDEMESYTVAYRLKSDIERPVVASAHQLHNKMLDLFDSFELTLDKLTSCLSLSLSPTTDVNRLRGALHDWSLLQMNRSAPATASSEFINDAHEDGCFLTVILADTPGLEIRTTNRGYAPFTPTPDRFLIIPGEILYLLSGGTVSPMYHRVVSSSSYPKRTSVLFFADIDPRVCEPWIVSDLNKSINIGHRVLQNSTRFGLAAWDAEQD